MGTWIYLSGFFHLPFKNFGVLFMFYSCNFEDLNLCTFDLSGDHNSITQLFRNRIKQFWQPQETKPYISEIKPTRKYH